MPDRNVGNERESADVRITKLAEIEELGGWAERNYQLCKSLPERLFSARFSIK